MRHPGIRRAVLLALSVLSTAVPSTPALAPLAPGDAWFVGDLAFPEPSTVDLAGPFEAELIQWQNPGAPGGIRLDAFEAWGSRIVTTYYEHVTLSRARPPEVPTRTLEEEFRDFDLSLVGRNGPQDLAVAGATHVRVQPGDTPWNLSTAAASAALHDGGADKLLDPGAADARLVRLSGRSPAIQGASVVGLYIYGFDVTVRHRDGVRNYTTGVHDVGPQGLPLPVLPTFARIESYLIVWTFDGPVRIADPDAPIDVFAPRLAVAGALRAQHADARLAWDDAGRVLRNETLEMRGAFEFAPRPNPADDTRYLLDVSGYAAAPSDRFPSATDSPLRVSPALLVAAGIALAGALVLAGWRAYTRLVPDELLAHPQRRRLFEAIRANPGATVGDLTARARLHGNTVRYHLGVLRRGGGIRAYRLRGAWRFVPSGVDAAAAHRASLLAADPKVMAVVAWLPPGGLRASEAVARLRRGHGISRASAWDAINRAAAVNLLRKERAGRHVMLYVNPPRARA